MDQIQQVINESIGCYRELLQVYALIREKVADGGMPVTLHALIELVEDLGHQARHADADFQAQAAENEVALEEIPLFFEWKTVLGQVRQENRQMQRHMKAAIAIIHEDLLRLKQGRQALSGYRSGQDRRGRKINNFSV